MLGTVPHKKIETGRLILRRPQMSDADDIFRCLSDEDVCRNIDVSRHETKKDSRRFLQKLVDEYEVGISTEWMIEEKKTNTVLGIINLYSFSEDFAYTGYFLEQNRWGEGFATEALSALKSYALSLPGLNALYALSFPENKASLRVLEKSGFSFEKKGEYRGGKNSGREIYRFLSVK